MKKEEIKVIKEGEDKRFYRVKIKTTEEVSNEIDVSIASLDEQINYLNSQIREINAQILLFQEMKDKIQPKVDEAEISVEEPVLEPVVEEPQEVKS